MKPLAGVAPLPRVVDPGVDASLTGRGHVVGAHDNERIRATQLEHDLLQVPVGDLCHGRARALRTGQRDPCARGSAISVATCSLVAHTLT
jgi:hypothetical protein